MPSGSSSSGNMDHQEYKALVRKVAERVWRMLRSELRTETERRSKRDRRR